MADNFGFLLQKHANKTIEEEEERRR